MVCASLRRCFFQGLHGASSSLATAAYSSDNWHRCSTQIPAARTLAEILTTTYRTAIPLPAVGLAARMEARSVVIGGPKWNRGWSRKKQLEDNAQIHGHYESQNFTLKDIDNTTHTMKLMPRPSVDHFTCADVVYYFEEGYMEKEMLHKYPPLKDCNRRLNVPIASPLNHYDDTDDGAGVLEEALNDAFEVNYCLRWRKGFRGEGVGGEVEKLEGFEHGDGGGMLPLRRWGRGDEVEAARNLLKDTYGLGEEILLGSLAIGRNEKFLNTIFPQKSLTVLETVAHLGLIFFLFLVGVALSITAFLVLARILAELKLLTIDAGRIAMAAVVVNDVGAWILLALAIALSRLINS
ncbi:Cation/H(+) antiporter 17 Protein CATION/H+ EXCHANGER 17 [Vigna angularis]|uniref:Cation/H(+) antiporter 17 Protein CATION/H+ EXCHANGER 17 n=1 Tax=Phaseolus angularis TaxID=3914 RepID=A0A8T0KT43_PHAAN|nr:Cation/H(+) antiporter 17 Protein CATION/H+ EXCHANGER 17 [Vigna angularis]